MGEEVVDKGGTDWGRRPVEGISYHPPREARRTVGTEGER